MSKVVLVTDIDTPLGLELAKRYADSGSSLIAASGSKESIESFAGLSDEKYLQVKWLRRSPISARNVVLSGINHFKRIDEAVILQTLGDKPAKTKGSSFGDMQFADIESLIDTQVKGSIFLIKEIIHYRVNLQVQTNLQDLKNKQGQTPSQNQTEPQDNRKRLPLTVVQYCESSLSNLSPLETFVLKGFETLVKSLAGFDKDITINGFLSAEVSVTEYADFIFKTIKEKIDKSNGRIFRFSSRQGIFTKKH